MLKRYIEYKETQQLRKDHLMKQKLQYALPLMAILGTLLIALVAMDAFMPASPAKSAKSATSAISAADQQDMQENQEIQAFADVVTKDVGTLTDEDFAVVSAHSKDPCYENNVSLPKDQMMEAIKACKTQGE